jgi:phosphoribosylformylglycinamidine synthase
MWQFSEVVDGMAEACAMFGTPVTGGNVSFYNETDGRGIHPTPVIGMVGLVEDPRHITTQWFKQEERAIILLGTTANDLGASCYEAAALGGRDGNVPHLDLEVERRVQDACLKIIQAGFVESAHDCSDGGLAVAIAESCFSSYRRDAVGCEVNLAGKLSPAALLFSETPSRIVLSATNQYVDQILTIAREHSVPATVSGRTGGGRFVVDVNGERVIDRRISEIEAAWRGTLPRLLEIPSLLAAEESLTS